MPFHLSDVVRGVRSSRKYFLRHLDGLTPAQWSWKPYPACKSVVETLAHLVTDDSAYLQSLQTGVEPTYEALEVAERDPGRLLQMLQESHETLLAYIEEKYADAPLDSTVTAWGSPLPLGSAVAHISSEDFYHAGQIAFIRMATDPDWDYYTAVYGEHSE
ncbi:MAG: DinB family protein [Armatimonadetes bacterium]|nr:DinB family protein [Armatimonadota bacterium]MDE2205917.1 DinB family protein [Armatimonadota bacterium]